MKRILPVLLFAACGVAENKVDPADEFVVDLEVPNQEPNDDIEIVRDDVPVVADRFERTEISDKGTSLVLFARNNSIGTAFIDVRSKEVVVEIDGDRLDGPLDREFKAMSAKSDPEGTTHFALETERDVYYAKLSADNVWSDPILVSTLRDGFVARDATVDVAKSDVVIAFTEESPDVHDDVDEIRVAKVSRETGELSQFAIQANQNCCINEFGEPAYRVSGPTIDLDENGHVHLLYEWQAFGETTIDYVYEKSESFSEPLPIARAAYSPCPALTVRDGVAHITYLLEPNDAVWYATVEDDEVSASSEIYRHPDPEAYALVYLALMVMDDSGVMHFVMKERANRLERLLYLNHNLGETLVIDAHEVEPGFFALNPRAGGLLTVGGDLHIGYETAYDNDDVGHLTHGKSVTD